MSNRLPFIPLTLWTLFCTLFFATYLLGLAHMPDGDFPGQFHATAYYQSQALRSGDWGALLWSPASYAGFPFAADPQTAVFYPPRWITLLLTLPWGFPLYALQLEAILHIWLAGLFTYLLAFALTQRRVAALLAALAFALGGYLTAYPMLQLAVLQGMTWLPLTLLLLRRSTASARPAPWLVGAGLSLALSALAGHPQTFLHISYLAAAYYLFLARRARWSWLALGKRGALVMGTTLGTAAMALLPTLHYLTYTTRRSVNYQFTANGLPLEDYVQLVLPGLRSHWTPEYSGLAALLLALIAWYGRSRNAQVGEIRFWGGTAVLAGWLALGDNGILFQLAYWLLPGFRLFQQQERLLGLVSLSLALLAALGTAVWLQADTRARRQLLRQAGLTTAVFLLLGGLYAIANSAFAAQPWPTLWVRQAALLGLTLLILFGATAVKAPQARPLFLLLIPMLFADLYLGTAGSVNRRPGSPAAFWPQAEWWQQLRAELPPLARIDSQNIFHANLGMVYGLEDIHGISPLEPVWLAALEKLPRERRWRLLGATHALGYDAPASATPILAITQNVYPERQMAAQLYRLPTPLPRAWLSYEPVVVPDETAVYQLLADPNFDLMRQVALHTDIPDLTGITPPAQPPQVQTTRLSNNALRITAQTAAPAILLISEWRYPGWRARLNGQPIALFPVNGVFWGARLPAGTHELLLQFRPWDVPLGAAITLLTLVVAGIVVRGRWPVDRGEWSGWGRKWLKEGSEWLERSKRRFQLPASYFPLRLSRFTTYALLPLILLAFALRLHTLQSQELRSDEAYGYPFVRLPLPEMLRGIIALGEEHPPLHYLMLNGWLKLAGDSEFALRFLAVLPGVLLLPLAWQLGRRWHGRSLGLLLATFTAVSPSLVWLGQDVRNQYVMVIFCGALATLLFQRALARPRLANWAAYALLCALTIYSHYYGIFALLAHGVALLALPAYRRHLPAYVLAGLAALALFSPWLLLTFSGWVGQLGNPSGMELAPYLLRVGRELTVGPALPGPAGRWLFLLALLLTVAGARAFWQKDRVTAVILLAWLWGALGGVFLVLLRRDIFNAYYVSPAAPAWWALIGMGLVSLWARRGLWGKGAALASSVALLLAAGFSLSNYYSQPVEYGRTRGYRQVAAHIAAHRNPNDLFLANFPDPSLTYYLRHLHLPYEMQPVAHETPASDTEQALAMLSAQYERLWFVPGHGGNWDVDGVARRWLDYHTLIEESRQFQRLTLTAYRPAHAVDAIMQPLGVPVGGAWATLEGYYVTIDGMPCAPLRPGATVAVTLIWRAQAAAPDDYTVFVHWLGADGVLQAQHDGVPLLGTRRTTSWQVGERLLDRHEFTIPETAVVAGAQLWVGLYHSQTITRLPFADGREALALDVAACAPLHANWDTPGK